MESEDGGSGVGHTLVNTPFIFHSLETPFSDSLMECVVSNLTHLLHSINAFIKLYNPIFLTQLLKAERLFYVSHFIRGKDAIKEGSFDVELLKIPVKCSSNMEDNLKG